MERNLRRNCQSLLPCTVEIGLSLRCAGPWHVEPISLRLALQQVLLIMESPYELSSWWKKLIQKLPPPWIFSTCKQDLKCVLVALLEYVFIIE